MTESVLVIGGGLAGLLAASRHLEQGREVALLEPAPEPGGAIAAREVAGVPLSIGAEAYSIASGAVDALLAELDLADRTVAPRTGLASRVVSAAGTHRAPSPALLGIPARPLARDARAVLGWTGALRAAAERFLPARLGDRPGASVADLVTARCGRRVAQRLVAPVVGGVHSADPAVLEFATASPALLAGLREDGSLTAAVRRLRAPGTRSAGANVRSLTPTMAVLPQRLAARIAAAGGEIRTGTPVARIGREDGSWWATTAAGERRVADRLVLACPPDAAAALLREAAPEIAAAIPDAPSAPVRLVALVLDAPALDALPSGTGALVAPGTPGVRAKALTHASAKWEHVAAAARAAHPQAASPHVVRLSYGRPGEELPDEEGIRELALADAGAILGTPLTARHLLGAEVIDWSRAMRQPGPGHRAALEALRDLLEHAPPGSAAASLELVGSWRSGTGIDAIVRAHQAARAAHRPTKAPRPITEGTRP
ncbi:protoporphyrinogen/coproporphyrinogen oxidase [Brachybacterium phenoliresistens]|uniref:Protoporphyrinogen oxidase n=1 Tax=Brachybacterium phenoliresistens TaxID=396014 RepID=Z9JP59_9MICO|nr:FAD-dependent oxidoreductase [Brachybacterium phenoliresistens]EWS79979.1 protoporphyrinogen oxidase [Brachybacterium phenoliresistens]